MWPDALGAPPVTLALGCRGAVVTVGTASALGAALSRCPSHPWGPQVSRGSGTGQWGYGQGGGSVVGAHLAGMRPPNKNKGKTL